MVKGQIKVTSHVARDFLQNSDYFSTPSKIVWEYVSNSLDAREENASMTIHVQISSNEIRIIDDGPGMSQEELRRFFTMHGENQHRKRGKRVRGKFGTGKCAAFGLANSLQVETIHAGMRNLVELHRSDIEKAKDGTSFPVNHVVIDEPASTPSGTEITITRFNIKPRGKSVDKVKSFVEKQLGRNRQRADVTINGHLCQFEEPTFSKCIEVKPNSDVANHIGDVLLKIKTSSIPLDPEMRGIDILSYGIWHETTLVEVEGRKFADRLFGEIEVPFLEDHKGPTPTFDNTRNNMLNRSNPKVITLLAWISNELELVRRQIEKEEQKRRKTREAKELAKEASRFAEILNTDFSEVELELERARSKAAQPGAGISDETPNSDGILLPGSGEETTPWQQAGNEHGNGTTGDNVSPGEEPRPGPSIIPGNETGSRKRQNDGSKRRRRATFSVEHENAGTEQDRSRYDRDTKTIYINLDFPWIASAFEAGNHQVTNQQFQQICFEVAAVEYAMAIQFEKIEQFEFISPEDPLYEVGETINRVMRLFVGA